MTLAAYYNYCSLIRILCIIYTFIFFPSLGVEIDTVQRHVGATQGPAAFSRTKDGL